ncbi:hypothetical protein TNCV_2124961 [Trichonephila clavipes]|nr:hypothetical protein TNCV_2124961 [Trichonephila clavipes]
MNLRICAGLYSTLFLIVAPPRRTTLGITGLEDSLRWRAIGRLEAGQSEAEVGRWLPSGPKVVSQLWNQIQTGGIVTRRVGQGCHRALAFAQVILFIID